jgi:hydroxymethylpyrimidine/phosphomethylpyrimidine kinase
VILTIAGFDPSCGAGIAADLKTFAAHDCYGVAAVTALTVQNTQGVQAVHPVNPQVLRECLESVMTDSAIRAVKIGMLGNHSNASVVAEFLEAHGSLPSILDPVLRSSSGTPLIDPRGFEFLRARLVGQISLITPNLDEAAALTGQKVESVDEMKAAAQRLHEMGASAVVVTGGHPGHADKAVDIYVDRDGLESFVGERFKPGNTHGTGCTFSSAVAANVALGRQLRDAVMLAKAYVAESIKKAYPTGSGRLPLNHFYRIHENPRPADHTPALSEVSSS